MQLVSIIAAFTNSIICIATLFIVIFMIGIDVATDKQKFIYLAINNPTPIIIEDILKLVSVVITCILILTFNRILQKLYPQLILTANILGFTSVGCLIINAILSLYTIFQAQSSTHEISVLGHQLNSVISMLAVGVIICNGFWYLIVSWLALGSERLPIFFCYLGLGIGIFSLVPPFGLFVLIMSIFWSGWLGKILLDNQSITPENT